MINSFDYDTKLSEESNEGNFDITQFTYVRNIEGYDPDEICSDCGLYLNIIIFM